MSDENRLSLNRPDLAKQWHPVLNENLSPHDVSIQSNKRVWWICENGHEWDAKINNRFRDKGCPYCTGRRVTSENCLAAKFPIIAEEWHPTKNGEITPHNIFSMSNKSYWWMCKRGHEWKATANNRTSKNSQCPNCDWHSTSYPEMFTHHILKKVFSDTLHRVKLDCLGGKEVDMYIPSLSIAIEYDGMFYHGDGVVERDKEKNELLVTNGIYLIRIRERGCSDTRDFDCHCVERMDNYSDADLLRCIKGIITHICGKFDLRLDWTVIQEDTEDIRIDVLGLLHNQEIENSLESKFPDVAVQWNYEKNGSLLPSQISYGSDEKVWWTCSHNHEWRAAVSSRCGGSKGCPYCAGQKVCTDNCLAIINPILSQEWHPYKNGGLTPYDVSFGSSRKVWWKCGYGHEWQVQISHRHADGRGCPFCSGRYATPENSLDNLYPDVANEFHPVLNESLSPDNITPKSSKKVWWLCANCGHEWKVAVADRTSNGTGCPKCSLKRRWVIRRSNQKVKERQYGTN